MERRRPPADDATKKSKEDGELHSLRLKLRPAEENEELRDRIIDEGGSKDMKELPHPDDLVGEEGIKIVSDVIAKVRKIIQPDDCIQDELKSTADSAFNSMADMKPPGGREGAHPSPSGEDELFWVETSAASAPATIPMMETNALIPGETNEPSKLASSSPPAAHSGINLGAEEHEQGSVFSPQQEIQHSPIHVEAGGYATPPTPCSSWFQFDVADDESSDITGFD